MPSGVAPSKWTKCSATMRAIPTSTNYARETSVDDAQQKTHSELSTIFIKNYGLGRKGMLLLLCSKCIWKSFDETVWKINVKFNSEHICQFSRPRCTYSRPRRPAAAVRTLAYSCWLQLCALTRTVRFSRSLAWQFVNRYKLRLSKCAYFRIADHSAGRLSGVDDDDDDGTNERPANYELCEL